MDIKQTLIAEIEEYCRRGGVAESTFGRQAINDGKFMRRIRAGGNVTTKTIDRVRAFMSDRPAWQNLSTDTPGAPPAAIGGSNGSGQSAAPSASADSKSND